MGGSTGGAAPGGSSGGGGAPGTGGAGGQSGVLLDEDFEGFDPQGWIVDHDNDPLDDDKVGNWAVIVDPGNPQNHIYQQQTEYSDDSWAVGGNVNWTDQILEVRVKLVSASHSDDVLVTLAGRLALSDTDPGRDDPNYYFVYLRGDGSLRMRKRVDGSTDDLFSTVHLDDPIQLGTWHTLRLSIQGTSLSASLDGEVMGTATDSELTHGGVGLMVVDGVAAFDDLSVTLP